MQYQGDWENNRIINIQMGKRMMKFANEVNCVQHDPCEVPVGHSDGGVSVAAKT